MRILVLAPHADDEVLGCGGVIARHVHQGDDVSAAILTNAALGAPELWDGDDIAQVRGEAHRAHSVLGVQHTLFEDLPAPRLDTVPLYQIAQTISNLIEAQRPEIVYLPHGGDRHIDHRIINEAAQVACRPRSGCSVRRLLAYETPSETEWGDPNPTAAFIPNWFVDISPFLHTKLRAMECYASQLKDFPDPRSLQAIRALATWRGAISGFAASECFALIRELEPTHPSSAT
jgi:LmbE family N-acetylglucosaminyl deacetylase